MSHAPLNSSEIARVLEGGTVSDCPSYNSASISSFLSDSALSPAVHTENQFTLKTN